MGKCFCFLYNLFPWSGIILTIFFSEKGVNILRHKLESLVSLDESWSDKYVLETENYNGWRAMVKHDVFIYNYIRVIKRHQMVM